MNCPTCGNKMKYLAGDHQYTESGLDNVTLKGIEISSCGCGEKFVSIPCVPELHAMIGALTLKKLSALTGKEIRFLRKNIGLRANVFASMLGVDKSTLSRWENGKQGIDKAHDRLIRVTYANLKGLDTKVTQALITVTFPGIRADFVENVPVMLLVDDWASQSACRTTDS